MESKRIENNSKEQESSVKKSGRRVTIHMDEDIEKKVRNIQAELIKESSKSVSFSKVICRIIEEYRKAEKNN